MSVLDDLIQIMISMIKNNTTGTFNFTNPGLVSHNEILEMYKEIINHTFVWENFSSEEQRIILDADRSINFLDTTKLEQYCKDNNIILLNIKDSIRETLIRMKIKIIS